MKKKPILTIVVFAMLLFTGYIHGVIPTSERAALIALYNSTCGDNWINNSGWKTTPLHTDGFAMPGTEGSWFGVTLSGGAVNTLALAENGLSGSIPSQLGNLSSLESLFLQENQLSGGIPSQLGNLSNLKVLSLSFNQLSGSIPSQLGNLSNLLYLYVSNNQLSGSIPSKLGNLIYLDSFHLDYNLLSGVIPSSFINLTNIYSFKISYNCLSASDPALIAWLNNHDPGWENHQDRCGSVKIPTVTTNSVSSITSNSAVCGGNVTSDGGAPVTVRGVCWNTEPNPTTSNTRTANGNDKGSFTSSITGLTPFTTYYVRAYAHNISGTSYGSTISFTTLPPEPPVIGLNHTALNFGAVTSGGATGAQTVLINNIGSGTLNWSAAVNASWLYINPSSGTGDSAFSVSVDPGDLDAGSYTGTITITDPNANNSPQSISVILQVYNQGTTAAPFGEFSAPLDGSSTYSSVPVTGWALDDIGLVSVKIYNGETYIGDAVFVEGARPDVQAAYPTFPNNQKAGWGYMLLTNVLPGGGNGTYTLTAKATDIEGNEVTLGSKTISIDNAHAVKPFGAIDTPTQGGLASGENFRNNGWVLTPMPNQIPTDGTTITIYIDGTVHGHPTYNLYRQDIAELFPGYANSNNAWGYQDIDTRYYSNGVHTIHWIATDTEGNSDGIGSRYFTIQNTGSDMEKVGGRGQASGEKGSEEARKSGRAEKDESRRGEPPCSPTFDRYGPVGVIKGYRENAAPQVVYPDESGIIAVVIKELERIEIQLGENNADIQGYMISSNGLTKLPIGSTLNAKSGTFSWSPGPGFLGRYSLVFVLTDARGQSFKKIIEIMIEPKFNGIQ